MIVNLVQLFGVSTKYSSKENDKKDRKSDQLGMFELRS